MVLCRNDTDLVVTDGWDAKTRPSEEPDLGSAGRARTASLVDADWCGLPWTPWVTLKREAIRQVALTLSGVYRIRRETNELVRLTYIGQTGRSLRERLLALAAGASAESCPFNARALNG